jgi:preprotein translocase subunit YajC
MLLSTLALLAEGQAQVPWWYQLLPWVFIIFILYMILIRPVQRQERERQALLASVKKNDKVLLTSGIYATVVSIAEKEDEIVVKVDDNTRLKIIKGAIMRNISGEEALKAARAGATLPVKADDKPPVTASSAFKAK